MNLKNRMADIITGIFFAGTALYIYLTSLNFGSEKAGTTSARFYPQALSVLLAFLSLILIVGAVIGLIKKRKADEISEEEKVQIRKNTRTELLVFLLVIAYAVMASFIKLLIPMPFFVFGLLMVLGYRKVAGLIIIPLAVTAVSYLGFDLLLGISLI